MGKQVASPRDTSGEKISFAKEPLQRTRASRGPCTAQRSGAGRRHGWADMQAENRGRKNGWCTPGTSS